ncbi:MAG: hypothetical protein EA339_13250 [Rhodobacteraceae bacterium]|nr:MAG: hypothetical protein EA339_13250 [Paracoccaceae bacterium]
MNDTGTDGPRRSGLSDFVPAYLRHRLLQAAGDVRRGTVEEAVVLLADLSGYSRISAAMVDSHARSAEEIGNFLNRLSDLIATTISGHGGSVIGYAGDASIAIWPVPYPDAAGAVIGRALACGLALQAALRDQRDPILAPVRLKIGVDCGSVWLADVGLGQGRRHLHLAGPVLEGLDRLGTLAGPGEVAMPAALLPRLGTSPTGHAHGNGWVVTEIATSLAPPATATPATDDAEPPASRSFPVDDYVPAWLADLLAQADRRWLAEFRSASILFLSITGMRSTLPNAAVRLDATLQALGAGIAESEGVVLQAMNDDKGLTVLCAWGLAGNTHEDDAARAIMAGQAAQQAVLAQRFDCGAGIASGKVFAGLIGGAGFRQYSVLGDTVNRAAALSLLRVDTPLIDSATADSASTRFEFARPQKVYIKGWETPWTVYADPREQLSERAEMHAFVGRKPELDRITALLGSAPEPADGAPIIRVEADAGMGKSRLLGEVRARLDGGERRIAFGAGDSLRRTTSLHLWSGLFRSLLPRAAPAGALQSLAADDSGLRDCLPLLAPLLELELQETPLTRGLDTATRGRLLLETIAEIAARLLRAQADVLVIEDAHWLDSLSWQVLAEARRKCPQLALLIVARPLDMESLPREAVAMLDNPACTIIALSAFSQSEAAALAAAVLDVIDLPDNLARLIQARCEGTPLYIKELTLALQDRGVIRTHGRLCTVRLGDGGLDEIELPEGIEGVVASRISNLDASAQLTLKAASVAGRQFDIDQLAAIRPAGLDKAALQAQMRAIRHTGLVEREGPDIDGFRFHHALIQKTAHDLLVQDQKVELHAAAASWLEAKDDAQRMAPVIAHHWSQALDHDRAVAWFERAAHAARAENAPAEIVSFTTRARHHAERASSPPDRARLGQWLFLEGNALMAQGYYRRSADTLRDAIRHLEKPVPRSAPAAILGSLREFARLKIGVRRRMLAPEARERALMVAEALQSLSEITYQHGEIPQTLYGALRALNLVEAMGGDSPIMAKIIMGTAFVGLSAPWALEPTAYRDRALAMCKRLDDDPTWSWVLFVAGVFEMGLGNLPAAQDYLGRCPEVCERTGEWKNWLSAMANYANALRVEGRIALSQDVDERLLAEAMDRGNVLAQVWARTAIAKNLIYMGEFEALDECLSRLDVLFATPENVSEGSADNIMTLHLAHAGAHVAAGRDSAALASLADVAGHFDSMASPGIYGMEPVMMMCDMIEVLRLRAADPGQLGAILRATAGYAKRLAGQYPGARAKMLYAKGDQAAMDGRVRRAARYWEAARADAARRGLFLDEAQAGLRLAERAGHSEAAAFRNRADTLLRDMGLEKPPLWSEQEA